MKSLLRIACLMLLWLLGAAQASEVVSKVFPSPLLQRDYPYKVYLPDGYQGAGRHYPVLYLLHGAGAGEEEWLDPIGLRQTLDRLIAQGQIQPMVVVLPGHLESWWVDGAKEKGESALLQELLPRVEREFRVSAEGRERLIGGFSAGGFGALNLVLKYPQRFAAAALLSPAIYDPLPPANSSAMTQSPFQTDGKFDPQRWRALAPMAHLDGYLRSGVKVPLFILSGDRDGFGIAVQAAQFYEKLRLHQSGALALRVVDGDHEDAVWRNGLPQALKFLSAALPAAPGPQALRVLSYNIRCGSCERADDPNHWSRRKFLVAEVMENSGADLIGLQEVEPFQLKDLLALLGGYEGYGLGRDDGAQKGEMNAVLVRRSSFTIESRKTLWLSPTPQQVGKGWDAMLNRTLTLLQLRSRMTGQPLNFLNTHFDHMGVQARDQSAALIASTLRTLAPGVPVVLTGDFNARSDFPGYRTLTAQLDDAELVSGTPPQGGSMSFNGFGTDLQPGNKIDYVFVSRGQQVLSHRIVTDRPAGLYPSDHFPVAVELLLR